MTIKSLLTTLIRLILLPPALLFILAGHVIAVSLAIAVVIGVPVGIFIMMLSILRDLLESDCDDDEQMERGRD